tara:strand:- start:1533 stop:2171 length:639 start_codon:yes stop_codon:yes gene_type:complete
MKKYFVLLLFFNNPIFANTINTTSNSTGSVTNQAVQVVPSRQFQYTMQGISCQGATLNISPFVSYTYGFGSPYEPNYQKPVYDTSDNFGLLDGDGNNIGDGVPDNPGNILYYEQVRTGMRQSNTSANGGITATFSIPLDRSAIRECKKAMKKQNELYEASLASKRLNYEMSRAKTCHELFNLGVSFVGEMAVICEDIRFNIKPITDHTHNLK